MVLVLLCATVLGDDTVPGDEIRVNFVRAEPNKDLGHKGHLCEVPPQCHCIWLDITVQSQ